MEIGETLGQAAEREVLEETGYQVKAVDVIGVYSDPRHVIAYDDGEVRQQDTPFELLEHRADRHQKS